MKQSEREAETGKAFRVSRFALVFVVLLELANPAARAEGYQEEANRRGAMVRLRLDKTAVPYSGRLLLTIAVEGEAPLEVEPIRPLTSSQFWDEQALSEPEISSLPGQRARWQQRFRLEPLRPDPLELSINPVRFRQGKDPSWIEQPWKPITVHVTTDVASPSLGEARDITPIRLLPEPAGQQRPWLVVGASLAALLFFLLGLGAWRRALRPLPEPPLLPHEWAARELERLDALKLPQAREVERYHTLLSDVLRHYLERRFGLHAPEWTTPEFLDTLRRSSRLPEEQQELLREFLGRCDLAKFARADYSVGECQAAGRAAREFIARTAAESDVSEKHR